MNIPNFITTIRLLLVPLFALLVWRHMYMAALWLFFFAGASDALDGYIAKRLNQCTWIGSLIDPLADKALIVTAVILLSVRGLLPWWLTMVIVGRDVLIVAGTIAYIILTGELEMSPSPISKINTFVQLILIFCTIGTAARLLPVISWSWLLHGATALLAFASGGHYIVVWSAKARRYAGR